MHWSSLGTVLFLKSYLQRWERRMGDRRLRIYENLAGCLFALVVAGCGGEKLPGLGQVSGTITMDGKPVADAAVQFTPTEAGATASVGQTDTSGNYELYYSRGNKGAKVGEHSVTVNNFRDAGESGQGQRESIPAKYNVTTELKATVKRGANKINFDLKSGGLVIQPNEEPGTAKKKGRSATGCG
jgi:hypothetical protein